jgi:hypothetical protein
LEIGFNSETGVTLNGRLGASVYCEGAVPRSNSTARRFEILSIRAMRASFTPTSCWIGLPVDPEITSDAMSTISTDYELTEIRGRDWELKYTVTVANDSDQALKVDIILYLTDQSGYHVDHFKVETGAWFIPGSERTFVGSIVVDSNKAENYRTLDVQFGRPDN